MFLASTHCDCGAKICCLRYSILNHVTKYVDIDAQIGLVSGRTVDLKNVHFYTQYMLCYG